MSKDEQLRGCENCERLRAEVKRLRVAVRHEEKCHCWESKALYEDMMSARGEVERLRDDLAALHICREKAEAEVERLRELLLKEQEIRGRIVETGGEDELR